MNETGDASETSARFLPLGALRCEGCSDRPVATPDEPAVTKQATDSPNHYPLGLQHTRVNTTIPSAGQGEEAPGAAARETSTALKTNRVPPRQDP